MMLNLHCIKLSLIVAISFDFTDLGPWMLEETNTKSQRKGMVLCDINLKDNIENIVDKDLAKNLVDVSKVQIMTTRKAVQQRLI